MAEMNKVDESQRMTVDERGNWEYPSAAESGRVEVYLPALPGGPNDRERLHVADFGPHVAAKIESSMNKQPYLNSGATQKPHQVLMHYVGAARGASLMDGPALDRMGTLAQDFEREPEQEQFFKQVIRPYLLSLSPKRR